jgi:hypothetical protein
MRSFEHIKDKPIDSAMASKWLKEEASAFIEEKVQGCKKKALT